MGFNKVILVMEGRELKQHIRRKMITKVKKSKKNYERERDKDEYNKGKSDGANID